MAVFKGFPGLRDILHTELFYFINYILVAYFSSTMIIDIDRVIDISRLVLVMEKKKVIKVHCFH